MLFGKCFNGFRKRSIGLPEYRLKTAGYIGCYADITELLNIFVHFLWINKIRNHLPYPSTTRCHGLCQGYFFIDTRVTARHRPLMLVRIYVRRGNSESSSCHSIGNYGTHLVNFGRGCLPFLAGFSHNVITNCRVSD